MFKTYTVAQLKSTPILTTKEDLFSSIDGVFDYALPQIWLNNFSEWCEKQGAHHLTYDLIRSTTVWSYTKPMPTHGRPVSACREVAEAIRDYDGREN